MITQEANPTVRCYGYARASGSNQVDSPQIQQDRIRRKAQDLEVDGIHWAHCRVDAACSATDTRWNDPKRRPEMGKLLNELEPGDHLIIWRLDRLERKPLPMLEALEHLVKRGVNLHVLEFQGMQLDLDKPMGRLMVTIMAGMAAFFIDQSRDALIARKQWRRERGLITNQFAGLGRKRRTKQLKRRGRKPRTVKASVWHAPTCDLIREIWRRHERAGESLRSIAVDFNRRGEVRSDGQPWMLPPTRGSKWGNTRLITRTYWKYCVMLALGRDLEDRPPDPADVKRALWLIRDFRHRHNGRLIPEDHRLPAAEREELERLTRPGASPLPPAARATGGSAG